MADKRLRLIVEAVTSSAQAALRSLGNNIKGFGQQAERDLQKPTVAAKGMGSELGNLSRAATVFMADMAMRYGQMAIAAVTSTAEMAASNLALEASFKNVALQYGLGADKVIEALKRASKGTIDDFSLMAAASTAMRLGVAKDIGEFEDLMKIAYVRARETGKTVADAWNWMAIGIGRGSPRILDNLNILIKEEQVMEEWAATIGKTVDELSMLERQEATRNAVLQQGVEDLENWNDTAYDAVDAFEKQRAASQALRQELGEMLLPAVSDLEEELSHLPTILDQIGYITGVTIAGMSAGFGKLGELLRAGDFGAILRGEAVDAYEAAERIYAVQDAARKANAEWGQMHQISARARMGLLDVGDAAEETTDDLEELAKAVKKAQDIWGDYGRSVAQENWQMARRVADAQFSATQAAENAAQDLYKIERDSADRSADLFASAAIREEADTARHYNNLRYMKQDLNDSLADMDWDYQRERQEAMDKAPWWIRQALGAEFAERDRIAKTGDAKALAAYDKYLSDKIKAIDPAYAIELEKLQEQHKHEQDIEKRDSGQALERAKDDWEIQQREQDRAMGQQLYELERNLGYQLDEWRFHQAQREESERHSMDNLITEHEHSLTRLYEDAARKLGELPPLYKHYGYENWLQFVKGWNDGKADVPLTIPGATSGSAGGGAGGSRKVYQAGAWNIPHNELALLHKGEMVLPAPVAQQFRELGPVTINLNLGGGYTPYQGQQMAAIISDELGRAMRRNVR